MRFARRLLGTDGYNLACLSTTAETLGQIAAIVSWKGTERLWTTYFVLDEFLEMDLKLANSSWTFLGTLREVLPAPWPAAVVRILSELQLSQRLAEGGPSVRQRSALDILTCRNAFTDSASTTGSETSAADSDTSHTTSGSSIDSARTPIGAASPGDFSVVGTDIEDLESRNFLSSATATPCRSSPTRNNGQELGVDRQPGRQDDLGQEYWIWDKDRGRYHLSGRSEDHPGYWYPTAKEFA